MQQWYRLLEGPPRQRHASAAAPAGRRGPPSSRAGCLLPVPARPQIMHSYRLAAPGVVEGRQRSCLYLQPQEERFFQAAGRAVAVYDYRFRMTRLPPPGDAPPGAAACVQTPKAVWQCV